MKNSWKRVAAGALSLAMVAGMMPANVGGLLTGGTAIVAKADSEPTYEVTAISGLIYDGTEKELVTTTGEGGTIYYKLSTDDTWKTDIPKATAAGNYRASLKTPVQNEENMI